MFDQGDALFQKSKAISRALIATSWTSVDFKSLIPL